MINVPRAREALQQLLALDRLNDTNARYFARLALSHLADGKDTHGQWLETYGWPAEDADAE